MNIVEIERAIKEFFGKPYDAKEFPFAFLECFGNSDARSRQLRAGEANRSDIGGVLRVGDAHVKTCAPNAVDATLAELRASKATGEKRNQVRLILATDGQEVKAEDRKAGQVMAAPYKEVAGQFQFFFPLAGVDWTGRINESTFNLKATLELDKLYRALLRHDPEWRDREHDMNHFMARLAFSFFAEDTGILPGENHFTSTVDSIATRNGMPVHDVIGELFRAMDTKPEDREAAGLPIWATENIPYVNGGLFSGPRDVPEFSHQARAHLLNLGNLPWEQVDPDIFGSMFQAITDPEERANLGMHYTSVTNILKVLNPLFLDDLRESLEQAGKNTGQLAGLRHRLSRIRVFDPACGSGNFLVVAYKEMRGIEARIDQLQGRHGRKSGIPIRNFRGIEYKDFAAELARLALIIAEYQCDVTHRSQNAAIRELLPLDRKNWIKHGNALRMDWLDVCPPRGEGRRKLASDDLLDRLGEKEGIDFGNEGGEIYICGNPPYLGKRQQDAEQKQDMKLVFDKKVKNWKSLDYVAAWFMKAAEYARHAPAKSAFVATNSICQGASVPTLWPEIIRDHQIAFAHESFKWTNLARHSAGVSVNIVGISNQHVKQKKLFSKGQDGTPICKSVKSLSPYLIEGPNIIVKKANKPIGPVSEMKFGNMPYDYGNLLLSRDELDRLGLTDAQRDRFVRRFYGADEFIHNKERYALWIDDMHLGEAMSIPAIARRIERVREKRLASPDKSAHELARRPHQMREMNVGQHHSIVVPGTSSENRDFLPVGVLEPRAIIGNKNYALYDAPLWNMALIASRLHLAWIDTVCGKLKTDYSYSNTLGWNTFPVPTLTEQDKADLDRSASDILVARKKHLPDDSIAELYAPGRMPGNLREAHDANEEIIDKIFVGRRFRNDSDRVEVLLDRYAEMTTMPKIAPGIVPGQDSGEADPRPGF